MNIQIFGSSKSFDSKKAERWFKERRIKYQYIDLVKKGVSPGEYRSIRAAVGYENLVNRECLTYRELGMDYLLPDAAEEKLLLYPEMFRAPIVRNGRQATVGVSTGNLADMGIIRRRSPHGFCAFFDQV